MEIGQLQTLTSYSLLKSTNQLSKIVSRAKELKYNTLAITDINNMHGVIEFYKLCIEQGIKPIIGLTISYNSEIVTNESFHLILLAKNNVGYQNLISISTHRMSQDDKEPFYLKSIRHLMDGLVVISPWDYKKSELLYLLQYDKSLFEEIIKAQTTFFTKNDFYQGVSTKDANEVVLNETVLEFRRKNINLITLEDVRYLSPEDYFSVEVLAHIDKGEKMSIDLNKVNGTHFLTEKEEVVNQFLAHDLKDALENNKKVSEDCLVEIQLHQKLLPKFPLIDTNMSNSREYLKKLCMEGLVNRGLTKKEAYVERINMELSIIDEMGFNDYFLIVWDVMKYAREHNIVTACRGSAAGSMVSYSLMITNVDPIEYNLLFERFLNKERFTMPDIDMDIPDNRREELLNYVHKKYGHQNVAQIATFGTLAAKMALRDVARVFGLSQNEANKWANAVPNTLKITLDEAYNQSKNLRELVSRSKKDKLLFETAKNIEGLKRHISTHAAGVVISDKPLTNYLPLQKGSSDIPLTQLTMGDVEEIGLLKMDFLGLRNLSIVGNTLESIKFTTGEEVKLDEIPLDDKDTLALFQKGDTIGIFQFESEGIKQVLRKLGPTSIEDIASVNALYRPGPMKNIDSFIARKKGKEKIIFPHINLKNVLGYTYGIIVYQEQIMQIASLMAGFSLGQADILRRAISKKKKEVLDIEREHFINGAITKGYTRDVSNDVYQYIEYFANYGFNRSHAVVYAVLAYQMAFLKVHYPENFFTSLLHSVKNNPSKTREYIGEAKKFGVHFCLPDINRSEWSFKISKGKTIFGFSSIKGVRKEFIEEIISIRNQDGRFSSLENFLIRINRKWLKESNILPLLFSGAFDTIHSNRKQLVVNLNNTLDNITYTGGNSDLLGVLSLRKEKLIDFSINERLNQEYDYLGNYISLHPTDMFEQLKKGRQIIKLSEGEVGQTANFLVFVLAKKNIRTKKGEEMSILSVNDNTREMEVVIFPKLFRKLRSVIEENEVYMLKGKLKKNSFNNQSQILAENLTLAKKVNDFDQEKKCFIRILAEYDQPDCLNKIRQTLLKNKGDCPVVLVFDQKKILLEEKYWVKESNTFVADIVKILSEEAIVFQ